MTAPPLSAPPPAVDGTLNLTASDGTAVQLRPLRREERDLVAGFYNGLSADSKYRRFLQPMPRLPKAFLDRLVDVDGQRHVAIVATVDGECVGIARYIALPDEPGAAEGEITVTDRYQGRRIGRLLVEALLPAAVRAGLTTLVWNVEPTNRRVQQLLCSFGVQFAYRRDLGFSQGRLCLPDRPVLGEPWTRLPGSRGLVEHHGAGQDEPNGSSTGIQVAGAMVVSQGVSHR